MDQVMAQVKSLNQKQFDNEYSSYFLWQTDQKNVTLKLLLQQF